MKKYIVDVEKIIKASHSFEVKAKNPDEAKLKVKEILKSYQFDEFEEVETNVFDPYE